MFIVSGLLFSPTKEICNTCSIHAQVNQQATILVHFLPQLIGFSLMIKLVNTKKLYLTPNAYDFSQDKINPAPTRPPQFHSLQLDHTSSLFPRNYRNTLASTDYTSQVLASHGVHYLIWHSNRRTSTTQMSKLYSNRIQ